MGDSSPKQTDWAAPGPFAFILAALVFAAFWNVILGLDTFVVRDFGLFSYPTAYFQRECFWKGELPWWNPLSVCGLPFLAQFNTLALYPPALFYLLFPLAWALPVFCLLHLYWGGLGMYFLAARWSGSRPGAALAGVVFAFNGLTLNFLMWPSHIATFAWIPWVLLLTERAWREGGKTIVPAALAAALQVLGGGPESILFTWLIAGMLCAGAETKTPFCRRMGRFVVCGLVALLLTAPQWLPFAELVHHGNRGNSFAGNDWAMSPWGWANFLVPMFKTQTWIGMAVQFNQYWTSSYYVGIGTISLAAVVVICCRNRRVGLVGAMTFAAMILALGENTFVYSACRKLFPFLGLFRFPIKFVIITSTLLPLLAAFAINAAEKVRKPLLAVAAVASILTVLLFTWAPHLMTGPWDGVTRNGAVRLAVLVAFVGAFWFFVVRQQPRWSFLPLLSICWLDLTSAMPWQNPVVDKSVYQQNLGIVAAKFSKVPDISESRLAIASASAHYVYYHPASDLLKTYLLDRAVFLSDCNLLDGVPKVDGFFSLYIAESARVLWMLDELRGAAQEHLKDFLGASQTTAAGRGMFDWSPRTNYLPIVSIGQAPVFTDDETAFAALLTTNFNFHQTVYLPLESKSQLTAQRDASARIVSKHFENSHVAIETESSTPTMLFLSQAYYPNWSARVDGAPSKLWRANFAFDAVAVPVGRHHVVLQYRENGFWRGLVLTLLGAAVCVALWMMPRCPEDRTPHEKTNRETSAH